MGIYFSSGALLVEARTSGVSFGEVATIGRLKLTIPPDKLAILAKRANVPEAELKRLRSGDYSEEFIRVVLGASGVTSFDYSVYQHADVVHDFNRPVPEQYHRRYDALIDGGTMEHMFDVRQVLTNYMNMLKVAGRIFIIVPANNLFGHGFYQFSTEFFYRVFCADNGFAVEQTVLIESPFSTVEASRRQRCFQTDDPANLGKRVRLVNDKPLMLFVRAQKTEDKPPFAVMPMQSDYVSTWEQHSSQGLDEDAPAQVKSEPASFRCLSLWQEVRRHFMQKRKHSLRNQRFFRRIEP